MCVTTGLSADRPRGRQCSIIRATAAVHIRFGTSPIMPASFKPMLTADAVPDPADRGENSEPGDTTTAEKCRLDTRDYRTQWGPVTTATCV